MTITTVSSREFNQDTSKAKKAARRGPVVITDRGRPAHVLMSIEHYESLTGSSASIIELLASPGAEKISFNPRKVRKLTRVVDLD
jgi:prevent-host-death family protein